MPTSLANYHLTGVVRGSQSLGGSGHICCSSPLGFSCCRAKVNTPWVSRRGTFVLLKLSLWSYQMHVVLCQSNHTVEAVVHQRSPFLETSLSDLSWFPFPTTPVLAGLAVRPIGENSTLHGEVCFWWLQGSWQVSPYEKHMLWQQLKLESWKGERNLANPKGCPRQTSHQIQLEAVASHSACSTCGHGAERAELGAGQCIWPLSCWEVVFTVAFLLATWPFEPHPCSLLVDFWVSSVNLLPCPFLSPF